MNANEALEGMEGLVCQIAGRRAWRCRHCDLDDLKQEARIAVLDSAAGFNPEMGIQFSTYAGRSVARRVNRTLQYDSLVSVGRNNDRDSEESLARKQAARRSEWIGDIDPADENDPAEIAERRDSVETILDAMNCLEERERDVFESNIMRDESLSQIAARLGTSKTRVLQIKQAATAKIREKMKLAVA